MPCSLGDLFSLGSVVIRRRFPRTIDAEEAQF